MHAFGPKVHPSSSFDAFEVLQTTNPGELDAQEVDGGCIVAESQGNIGVLKKEAARNKETITATHAEQGRHVVTVYEAGRARLEGLRNRLEGGQYYELTAAHRPTRILPHEVMAQIFDWHMLMGGRWTTTLLVCKQWKMVAYSSPRLWSRISVTTLPHRPPNLRGSVLCTDVDCLRLVLSRSRSCPLQIELAYLFTGSSHSRDGSNTSLTRGPQATANRTEAVKLILSDQLLKRCTSLVLVYGFLPFNHLNTTVLPLLSSIESVSENIRKHELLFIQSLANLSPALRHIRCNHSLSAKNQRVGLWTKRIESYSCISPFAPCHPLHGSPSLRRLEVFQDPGIPLTLPALQILKWTIGTYSVLHRITAPYLHTLILRHGPLDGREERQPANSISFLNLRVAIHTGILDPTVLHMFDTPLLEHLSIEYRSSSSSPTALLKLFDGWANMPRPKSLHLDCTFTDAALISVLGRLPWLEELKVAGTVVRNTFWEGLASSCNSIRPVSPPYEHVTCILVPNLKVLLVNYPTSMRYYRDEMTQASNHLDDVLSSGDWTVTQILAVAAARKQAGCPLRTLACWSPGQGANVLVGYLDNRPRWDGGWLVIT